MRKKPIAGIIATVVIVATVIFAGCIESTTKITKIGDIIEQPDEYVDKRVTVEGQVSSTCRNVSGWPDNFGIKDGTGEINVYYDGDLPKLPMVEKVRVTGIVRTETRFSREIIYIAGGSWEEISQE